MSKSHETLVWVSLEGFVAPAHRREGIGTSLLSWQECRGLQMLSALNTCLPALVAADFWDGPNPGARLFKQAGYIEQRWWLELERDLNAPWPRRTLPSGYRLEGYVGQEEASRRVHNLAFRDHWGSQPISQREWMCNDAQTRTDLSFVVKGEVGCDVREVLAYVICAVPQKRMAGARDEVWLH